MGSVTTLGGQGPDVLLIPILLIVNLAFKLLCHGRMQYWKFLDPIDTLRIKGEAFRCWNGPYEPGIWNDEMIFENGLVSMLEYGGRCETDMEDIREVHLGLSNVPSEFGGGETESEAMQQKMMSR